MNFLNSKIHHEGFAIGNGEKFIVVDYGKKGGDLDFNVTNVNDLNDWTNKKIIGDINKSNEEICNILFGNDSEQNWSSSKKYNFIKHNCQDFVEKKIYDLTK